MKEKFEYSVAIRTVGKAGEKYLQELRSLHQQTVKPKHIFVHLAHGFDRPKEQVGMEEYIDTPRGLVHQRAASCEKVDTEYLLILDDDIYFPEDGVEKLYEKMKASQADCIAPDTFHNHHTPWKRRVIDFFAHGQHGRRNDGWAIKIGRNGTFSYNLNPDQGAVLPTMSAPGTACLVKTQVFRDIHYEDEQWIDQFPAGTFGEDQVMFHKMHLNGYHVVMAYDTGILHLDAGTNNIKEKSYSKLMYRAMSLYLTWHRCCYQLKGKSIGSKILDDIAYITRFVNGLSTRFCYSLFLCSPKFFTAYLVGHWKAKRMIHQKEYKNLSNIIISKKK